MAAEVGVVLPAYVEPLVAILVMIISGVAIRLGWMKAKNIEPEREVEMAGALVDSRAVKSLIDALDFAMDRITELHDMRDRREKIHAEDMAELTREVKQLRVAIQDISRRETRNGV